VDSAGQKAETKYHQGVGEGATRREKRNRDWRDYRVGLTVSQDEVVVVSRFVEIPAVYTDLSYPHQ
jgi:hypothetical protein